MAGWGGRLVQMADPHQVASQGGGAALQVCTHRCQLLKMEKDPHLLALCGVKQPYDAESLEGRLVWDSSWRLDVASTKDVAFQDSAILGQRLTDPPTRQW